MEDLLNDIEYVTGWALSYYHDKKWGKAIEMFIRLFELVPNCPYMTYLADAYEQNGDLENAERCYLKLAESEEYDVLKLADFYFRHHQYEKALPIYVERAKGNIPFRKGAIEQASPDQVKSLYEYLTKDYEKILKCYDELGITNDPFRNVIEWLINEHCQVYQEKALKFISENNSDKIEMMEELGFGVDK